MKILTFLGVFPPKDSLAYVMPDGQIVEAPFFGVALAKYYPNVSMRVFVTRKAQETNLAVFEQLTGQHGIELQAIDIPDGRNEVELWDVFETVVGQVNEEEEIIFDITHGFRSLPFLSFLAAAYLRTVKQVHLQSVLYGNFEASDRTVTPNQAPVIDLTPFVTLLDWMISADRFIRFGDAQDLAEQLRKTRPTWQEQQKNKALADQSRLIGNVATSLDKVSRALRLLRPIDAMNASEDIQTRFSDAIQQAGSHARPFRVVAQEILACYAPIALSERENVVLVKALATERMLVKWYLDRKQYVPAVAIAREWIVSWLMAHIGYQDLLDRNKRKETEEYLGKVMHEQRQNKDSRISEFLIDQLQGNVVPDLQKAVDLFDQLGNVRNDLLHAGKRKGALPAEALEKRIIQNCNRLQELQLPNESASEAIE